MSFSNLALRWNLPTKFSESFGKRELHVTISQPNNRLFVGSIPKTKTKEEIFDEFHKHTSGLTEVILYYQVDEKNKVQNGATPVSGQKNRGFCFLEYDTHQAASQARRRLLSGILLVIGYHFYQNKAFIVHFRPCESVE